MRNFEYENYAHYVSCQIDGFNRKKDNVWVRPSELNKIIKDIRENLENVEFGICHGVRTGFEVDYLRRKLKGTNIIGTEIGPTDHSCIIQMDFHDIKDEWVSNVDFIYSNSFDHSNRPAHCLKQWRICLKENGILYLTWVRSISQKLDSVDCLSAELNEYEKGLRKAGFRIVRWLRPEKRRVVLVAKKEIK